MKEVVSAVVVVVSEVGAVVLDISKNITVFIGVKHALAYNAHS